MNSVNSRSMAILIISASILAAILMAPTNSRAADIPPQAINLDLPIHKGKKLHPEFSDPVLGDRAAIIEWAWSPQYAKRFKQPVQADGLKDGALWLIGIKITRQQYQNYQRYTCNIIGLMDNKLPILTPPGEIYTVTPGAIWIGGLPGFKGGESIKSFNPAHVAWIKNPKNEKEKNRPEWGMGGSYMRYYKNFQSDLAYFEIEGSCGDFQAPQTHRNELRFPTRVDGKDDENPADEAVFEPSALRFDMPDGLMQRIYPHLLNASDWTSCLLRRVDKSVMLTLHATRTKRFGNTCEPALSTR